MAAMQQDAEAQQAALSRCCKHPSSTPELLQVQHLIMPEHTCKGRC